MLPSECQQTRVSMLIDPRLEGSTSKSPCRCIGISTLGNIWILFLSLRRSSTRRHLRWQFLPVDTASVERLQAFWPGAIRRPQERDIHSASNVMHCASSRRTAILLPRDPHISRPYYLPKQLKSNSTVHAPHLSHIICSYVQRLKCTDSTATQPTCIR